ncbi:MAG: hypothetical protein HKN47_00640 [Pirellulaceae bacterium]|nr:hypothetical protein [Pirellulaceae bacterium]
MESSHQDSSERVADLQNNPASELRELELELIQVRKEAVAARLEARAAELELLIRRHVATPSQRTSSVSDPDDDTSSDLVTRQVDRPSPDQSAHDRGESEPIHSALNSPIDVAAGDRSRAIESWDQLRQSTPTVESNDATSPEAIGDRPPDSTVRVDGSHNRTPNRVFERPLETPIDGNVSRDFDSHAEQGDVLPSGETDTKIGSELRIAEPADDEGADADDVAPRETKSDPIDSVVAEHGKPAVPAVDVEAEEVEIEADDEDEEADRGRRKPAAWLASLVAHVAILLLLAAFTLTTHRPKDQVALSASVSEASEEVMETFEFETSEPVSEASEPTESDVQVEISPIGEIAVSDFSPDAISAPAPPTAADLLNPSKLSAASMSLKSNSESKIQFCGVEGGGNHFVYLVDSSGSMGAAFDSARAELLQSIDALKPDQKFYVIFFDAESDYMRLRDPNSDEPRSVKATADNKQALRRWAMRISMDRGRAPYDPLKFALGLKPDVIFLLSDGEFPQGIEDLLKESNHFSNLFGDQGLVSIVHTIGYHSREGESRMRRIAEQNAGQYRHVPKP